MIACAGHWTSIRGNVSSNANLYRVGEHEGFGACINVNASNPVVISQKLMAAAIEAVIGAAFLDGGLDAVEVVMKGVGLLEADGGAALVTLQLPILLCETLRINMTYLSFHIQRPRVLPSLHSLESFWGLIVSCQALFRPCVAIHCSITSYKLS